MKKNIAILLAFLMCLSLCACGGQNEKIEFTGKKITVADIETALKSCDGTLNVETSDEYVTEFTYVVEDISADYLEDREFTREAFYTILSGDTSNVTGLQIDVAQAFSAVMCIDDLLSEESGTFDIEILVDRVLDIICDGTTANYNGWKVSSKIDHDDDSITIKVTSK